MYKISIGTFRFNISSLLIWLLAFSSCDIKVKEVESTLDSLIGRRLVISKDLTRYQNGHFIPFSIPQNDSASFEVVTFIDGSCSACLIELYQWEDLVNEFDILKTPVTFVLYNCDTSIFNPQNEMYYDVVFPIIIDSENQTFSTNNLNNSVGISTFLLDKHKAILLAGNPLSNKMIRALYFNAINGVKSHNLKSFKKLQLDY